MFFWLEMRCEEAGAALLPYLEIPTVSPNTRHPTPDTQPPPSYNANSWRSCCSKITKTFRSRCSLLMVRILLQDHSLLLVTRWLRVNECLRTNPPTRVNCIYCGALLPLNETYSQLTKTHA